MAHGFKAIKDFIQSHFKEIYRLLKRIIGKIDPEYMGAITKASVLGLHLVSGILVGAIIGYLLDQWLDTSPWLFLTFIVIGILAGFNNLYIDAKRLIKSQDKQSKKQHHKEDKDDKSSSP